MTLQCSGSLHSRLPGRSWFSFILRWSSVSQRSEVLMCLYDPLGVLPLNPSEHFCSMSSLHQPCGGPTCGRRGGTKERGPLPQIPLTASLEHVTVANYELTMLVRLTTLYSSVKRFSFHAPCIQDSSREFLPSFTKR
jgi:hypothetical protein